MNLKKQIKGLYVDGSGVLWSDGFPKAVSQYAELYGIDPDTLQKIKDSNWPNLLFGRINSQEFWGLVFSRHGIILTNGQIADLNNAVLESHRLYHNVMATVKELRPNYTIGLLTNSPKEWTDYWRNKFGLDDLFHLIVIPSESGFKKPDVEMFQYSATRMGIAPENIAVYDDQRRNVDGAKQAGMVAVEVIPGTNPLLELVKR